VYCYFLLPDLTSCRFLRLLATICSTVVFAGSSLAFAGVPQRVSKGYEIRSISFEGNEAFSTSKLLQITRTRETPGFFSKTLHGWFEVLGRANEYYEPTTVGEDLSHLRQHYRDYGFQDFHVDTLLAFDEDNASVDITFKMNEGYHSIIDTLIVEGVSVLPRESLDDVKIKKGDFFNKFLLEEEVKRIIEIFNNEGYARAMYLRDSSSARYYTSSKNYSVRMVFASKGRYRFGHINALNELPGRDDIDSNDVLRQLDYEDGSVYNVQSLRSSERNLNRTGVFDLARITVQVPPETSNASDVLSFIRLRPKDKHELAPEISFSDENLNFNLGVGLGYSNRNFFGGTRTASTRVRFRTATLGAFPDFFTLESDAIANLDLTFELLQPYIFTNKVKGSWSLSWIRDKQEIYLSSILQNKFGFSIRFAEFTTGYLDWTMQLVKLDKRNGITIDSTNTQQLVQLRDLTNQAKEEQFNSILSFTIQRDMTNDIFSPSRGFIHALTIEEAGILPTLLQKWGISKRPFTQFYRTNVIGRWYADLTQDRRFSIFALKLRAGFEEKYGGSRSNDSVSIPQTHRFYAGGGGSIRGWTSRGLSAGGEPLLGGNLIFEGSMELRTNILQSLRDDFWDRLWTVLFFDAGNVWPEVKNLQLRGVALATGIGIRYDTFFGPFRIDYGLQVYDPATTRWITQRKFWGETLRSGILHFGIGHAF
jgi:outer membrane protein assembly complex protein YaeT